MPKYPAILFQQFFDKGPPTVILKANVPHFTIITANEAYLKVNGFMPKDIEGKSLWAVFPENTSDNDTRNREAVQANLVATVETRQPQVLKGMRYDIPRRDTNDFEKRYWQVTSSPVLDDTDKVSYIIYVVDDITEAYQKARNEQVAATASDQRKEQLQQQFMRAPIGMMFVSANNYAIEYANDAMRLLLNKAPAERIIGEQLFKVLPELEQQGYRPVFDQVLASGISYSVVETPLEYKRTDKLKTFYLDLTVEPLYNDEGQISGAVGFALDATDKVRSRAKLQAIIDEKKIIETHLRNNEERLVQILETMAEGVSIVDAEGKLTYANPMAQQILGLHEKEILSHTNDNSQWQNLKVDGTPLPEEEHPMAIMMATGKPVYDHEIAIQPPDGERFYISINAAPIRDSNNNIVLGIGTFMDVTGRRKMAEQKDEFISVASHELKTPLTSLKLSMQLLTKVLKDNRDSDKIPLFLEKANDNLNKLVHLTEDLMNVSKIDHGKLPLKKTWFNLYNLVDDCCDHVKGNDNYEVMIQGDETIKVYADAQRIDQVIVNFVNNAVKYAPNSRNINIKVERDGKNVRVSVQDFGIGIPPEKVPHLFERYYRVDQSGIQFSGLGLGLYISGEIIERHNGKIGVESIVGSGSTFWFTLPLN